MSERVLVLPRSAVPGGCSFRGVRATDADALSVLRRAVAEHGRYLDIYGVASTPIGTVVRGELGGALTAGRHRVETKVRGALCWWRNPHNGHEYEASVDETCRDGYHKAIVTARRICGASRDRIAWRAGVAGLSSRVMVVSAPTYSSRFITARLKPVRSRLGRIHSV